MAFEKGHQVTDPERAAFQNQVSEIWSKVDEILMVANNSDQ